MSSARELITLQFGNYANYVGTHWWNIQESCFSYDPEGKPSEINHDVLFREGVNHNRQTTFTPRLLLVDLEGSLKHLPREGELYGNSIKRQPAPADEAEGGDGHCESVKKLREDVAWQTDGIEVVSQPEVAKNPFQTDLDNPDVDVAEKEYDLADNVDSWADFLYSRYHPRTVHVVKEYKHEPDKLTLDTHTAGALLWKSTQFEDEFCDRIRQYVEECDYLQGFQTLFDCFDGHSGLATSCLAHLNDEYGKATFAVPLYSPRNTLYQSADEAMSDSIRVANSALAFHHLAEQASMFVPLSTASRVWRQLGSARPLPLLQYKADNLYQTAGILAAYLDTISLRYRLRDSTAAANTLGGFCGDMTNYGRKLVAGALALPFAMQHNEDLIDCLDRFEGPLLTSLTPNCSIGSDYVVQALCVRGIPPDRLKRPREQAQKQMQMAAYKCSGVSEMVQLYLQCQNHASLAHVAAIPSGMPTRIPFPSEMLSGQFNEDGFLVSAAAAAAEASTTRPKVHRVPTVAAVQSSSSLGDTLETLHREAKRIKISKLHRFKAAGLEEDDLAEALESLLLFKDNYEDNFEL